jgi:putative tryptophan/tyrosine transport system substrate-binding protein
MTMWCSAVGCLVTLILSLLVAPLATQAQPAGQMPRIGVLVPGVPPGEPGGWLDRFRQGLRDLGYVEGQTITLELRWDEHHRERWPDLAADLVCLRVDLIVAGMTAAAQAAQHATSTIPIVMAVSSDPVGDGLVASLAQPGGNLTGLSIMTPGLTGKRLELLSEAVPGLARLALLLDAGDDLRRQAILHDHAAAARGLGVQLQPLEVRSPEEFAGAFEAALQGQAQALILQPSPLFAVHRARLAELALASRLPTMATDPGYARAGGLMDYGGNILESWYRAAYYVDRLLKGAKPADLPVEQPRQFKLVLNLKTAQALGITFPPTLLFQADEVIQ